MSKKFKRFLIDIFITFVSSVLFKIFTIFFNSYISQQIGKESLGVFNIIMSIYFFGITLGQFGINFSSTKLVSESLAIKNNSDVTKISKRCLVLSFFCGTIASLILFILANPITKISLHGKVSTSVIYLICLGLPFLSMSSAIYGYFVAVRKVYKSIIAQIIEQFFKLIFTIFLLNHFGYNCLMIIAGDVISEFFAFFINYILYKIDLMNYKTNYTINYSPRHYNSKILKISFPIATTSLCRSGLSSFKQILIPLSFEKSCFNYSKSLALYGEINGMAIPIILFPNIIFTAMSSLLVPEFASYNVQNRHKSIKKYTLIIFVISVISSAIISIFLFIFSKRLGLLIYNDNSVSKYIKIFAPLSFFACIDCVVDNILKGLGAQNQVMFINILDSILDVILIFLIVPKLGVSGYIFSIYFTEILNLILSLFTLKKVS